MKISASKKQLAKIISENGGWREGNHAVQDKDDKKVWFMFQTVGKPSGRKFWPGVKSRGIQCGKVIPNWHQTILSRDEYFHLYPAQDADGWIEWKGGLCPVDIREVVDIQYREGTVIERADAGCFEWQHYALNTDIIAYRLHKKEQPHDVEPEAQDAEVEVVVENRTACHLTVTDKPTIEQLAAEYRNRKDYAERKQQEADAAKAEAEAKLAELVAAGKAVGLEIFIAKEADNA